MVDYPLGGQGLQVTTPLQKASEIPKPALGSTDRVHGTQQKPSEGPLVDLAASFFTQTTKPMGGGE